MPNTSCTAETSYLLFEDEEMVEEGSTLRGLLELTLVVLLVVVLLPLVPSRKVRYYGCYIHFVGIVSFLAIVLAPIFALRPRNILNLTFSSMILKNFTRILGIRWELRNGEILKQDRAAVVTANHQTILDIMGMHNIWEVMRKCTVAAKKELLYIIPFGPTAWLAGLVFIDRNNPKIANTQLAETSQTVKRLKAKFWMFPEGTRNNSSKLLPFKKGAFRIAIESQVPIIPVVYSPYYFIDSKNKTFDEGKVIISVLDCITTEGMTMDDVDKLKEKTYQIMSEEWERLKEEIAAYQEKKNKFNFRGERDFSRVAQASFTLNESPK